MISPRRFAWFARLHPDHPRAQLSLRKTFGKALRTAVAILCSAALIPGDTYASVAPAGQASSPAQASTPAPAPSTQATPIPADQLDSLVAPIALYPDPLLAQCLAASTYPLEIIQLQQWLKNNPGLKDQALSDAVAKQPWDPSVQSMAGLPDVVDRLANNVQWTTDLGNAFLSQQTDVMAAVQRMRKKAQDKGTLKTTEQQKVETEVIEGQPVVVIQQANPQVVYVPSYDPVYVYGPPVYPYPPGWYYPVGVGLAFGVGIFMGAMWGGGWCCGCGWGGNDITINRNNNFNRNSNISRGNRPSQLPSRGNGGLGDRGGLGGNNGLGGNRGDIGGGNRPSQLPSGGNGGLGGNRGDLGGNRPSQLPSGGAGDRWQHDPGHRGGTPYRDRATADRFGGTTRGDSLARRQAGARQQLGRQGGITSPRAGQLGGGGIGSRGGAGGLGGGADRIGSRDLSRSGGGNSSAFGGGNRGFNGSSARASGSRGASSMGSRGGGGMSRGGGGRGGGGGRRR